MTRTQGRIVILLLAAILAALVGPGAVYEVDHWLRPMECHYVGLSTTGGYMDCEERP